MSDADWNSPTARTLQYLAASTPEFEEFNRILLIVHGLEQEIRAGRVEEVVILWRYHSADEHDDVAGALRA